MKTKIYALLDENGGIRYIGKTAKTLEKRLHGHLYEASRGVRTCRCDWVRSLMNNGIVPEIMLLGEVENNSNKAEIAWIAYGREENWELTNSTSGGGGVVNPSLQSRKKMSAWQIGKHLLEATKIKISNSLKGKPSGWKGKHPTEATRIKISNSRMGILPWNTGKHLPDTMRKKISNSHKGKHITEEAKIKISNTLKGRPSPQKGKRLSAETLKKMSAAHIGKTTWNKGKHHSDATRKKISDSTKGRVCSEKTKEKMRIAALLRCSKMVVLIFFLLAKNIYSDSVSLYEENDFLENNNGETVDGYYTQGFQAAYRNDQDNWGLMLKQQIYTPENKDSDQPQYDDRPYCGFLNLTFFKDYYKQDNAIDTFSIGLGIVGPQSGAEWVQTEFHKLCHMALPMGWRYQIKFEPVAQISYFRTYSIFLNKYMEYRPFAGVNLGNALTDGEIGNTLRAGWNIPKKFDPVIRAPIQPDFKDRSFTDYFFAYAFIGVKGKIVARDISLDGNTFKDNIVTVDKEICVADFYFGASLGLKYVDLTFTHVERTKEFETQTRDNRFDSIQLSYNW